MVKHLVLAGGGHSHIGVPRRFGAQRGFGHRVTVINPDRYSSGPALETTFTVWITGAAAPSWLDCGRLVTDASGFLMVDGSLRSVSHPWVLGAGDVASLASQPVPKAGVYAVRQGPVLAENLMRLLRDEPPIDYKPQQRFLSLLSLGERRAVASWSNWTWSMGLEAEGSHRPRIHAALRVCGKHTIRIPADTVVPHASSSGRSRSSAGRRIAVRSFVR
jgi:hypothetical protein